MPLVLKRIFAIFAALFGILIILILTGMTMILYLNDSPVKEPQTVRFEVKKGESSQSVGKKLFDSGYIRSLNFWRLLCRVEKNQIKSGTYQIELPASQITIYRLFINGKQMLLRITVPEGYTLKKTAALFEDAGICGSGDFLSCAGDAEILHHYRIPGSSMEGYLFPDTYLFPPEYPAAKVIQTMADTFYSRLESIDSKTAAMSADELNRLVILASIIEREYRLEDEAPVMAGVFLNRLAIGMALQSCATVVYVITEIQDKPHPEFLTAKDLEIRSPYNTYMHPGLPPGPVSSPGIVALNAALHPEKTNYLYFRLVDPASGRHYFSRTLDDHIKAGTLFVKGK